MLRPDASVRTGRVTLTKLYRRLAHMARFLTELNTIKYSPEKNVVDFKNSIQNQKFSLYEKTDFLSFTKVLSENLYIKSKLIFLDLLNNVIPGAT